MRHAWLIGLTGLFTACGGIGDGNAPKSMELRINGESEAAEVFICASQFPSAILNFSDGSSGDFVYRVEWTSSDPEILTVSDGKTPLNDEEDSPIYVNGALLPRKAGTVTLSASYLDGLFVDDIEVTVSESSLELSPAYSEVLVGRTTQVVDTIVSLGRDHLSAADLTQIGLFSIDGINPDDYDNDDATETPKAPAAITEKTGVLAFNEAGTYTVRYGIDFCGREATATVKAIDEAVQALEVRNRDDGTLVDSLELLLDSSVDVDVIGILESGHEINMTNAVSYRFVDADGETVNDVAFSNLRGVGSITAYARPEEDAEADPVTFPRTATLRVSFNPTPGDATEEEVDDDIYAADIALSVLESELVADSLVIEPAEPVILPGTGMTLVAKGDFSGAGGDFASVDVSKDVQWTSSETTRATINNVAGSKGFVFAPSQRFEATDESSDSTSDFELITNVGTVTLTATRFSKPADAEEKPSADVELVIGRPDAGEGEEPLALVTLGALTLSLADDGSDRTQNQRFAVHADGELMRDGESVANQRLSGQVIWDIVGNGSLYAQVSNRSGSKGEVTVLTDQTVTITVRARYLDTLVQDAEVSATLDVELNPSDS